MPVDPLNRLIQYLVVRFAMDPQIVVRPLVLRPAPKLNADGAARGRSRCKRGLSGADVDCLTGQLVSVIAQNTGKDCR